MNTTKNTEKKSRKTTKANVIKIYPPVDCMDAWAPSSSTFIENKNQRYSFKYAIVCVAVGFGIYWGYANYLQHQATPNESNNSKYLFSNLNKPQQPHQLVQLENDYIRDNLDTAEENFIENQIGQEFSKRDNILFQDSTPTLQSEHSPFQNNKIHKSDVQQWLIQQHIQGVAYKDFESCLIFNEKIFHLNDTVSAEHSLVWSDIDPIDKTLFFSDNDGNLYTLNY